MLSASLRLRPFFRPRALVSLLSLATASGCFRGADVSKIVCNDSKYCPSGYACVIEAQKIEGRCEKLGDGGGGEASASFDSGADGVAAMKDGTTSDLASFDAASFMDGPADVDGVPAVDGPGSIELGPDITADAGPIVTSDSALDGIPDTEGDAPSVSPDALLDLAPDLALDLPPLPPDLAPDLPPPSPDMGSDLAAWVPGPCTVTQPLISDMEENNPGDVSGFWNGCVHGFWWDTILSGPGRFPPATLTPRPGSLLTYATSGCPTHHCASVVAAGDFSIPYYYGWMMAVTLEESFSYGQTYTVDASTYQGITFTAQATPEMSVQVLVPTSCTESQAQGGTCNLPATCGDYYSKTVIFPSTSSTTIKISFADPAFKQAGFGAQCAFDKSTLLGIQFRVSSTQTVPAPDGTLIVDDLYFY
jgi:hypothetical protein